MSYNIDSITVLYASTDFGIRLEQLDALRAKYELQHAPEISIFDPDWPTFSRNSVTDSGFVRPQNFWWNGEGSGHSYGELVEVLSHFDGSVDLELVWEGGNSIDGLKLRNHAVTRHEVVRTLGKEIT